MAMERSRDEVQRGLVNEVAAFAELIRTLDDGRWAAPSRCAGWSAADVAAHVVGTISNIVAGDLEGIGTHEANQRQVEERRDRRRREIVDELAVALRGFSNLLASFDDDLWNTPGVGDQLAHLWYGIFVHADDIRHATGQASAPSPEGMNNAVAELAKVLTRQGWGPATLHLDGVAEIPIGTGGPPITGDPLTFVLAATGRTDPSLIGLDDTVNIYA